PGRRRHLHRSASERSRAMMRRFHSRTREGFSACRLRRMRARLWGPFPEAVLMPEDKFLKQATPGLNTKTSSGNFTRLGARDIPAQPEAGDNRGSPRHAISISAE